MPKIQALCKFKQNWSFSFFAFGDNIIANDNNIHSDILLIRKSQNRSFLENSTSILYSYNTRLYILGLYVWKKKVRRKLKYKKLFNNTNYYHQPSSSLLHLLQPRRRRYTGLALRRSCPTQILLRLRTPAEPARSAPHQRRTRSRTLGLPRRAPAAAAGGRAHSAAGRRRDCSPRRVRPALRSASCICWCTH